MDWDVVIFFIVWAIFSSFAVGNLVVWIFGSLFLSYLAFGI